MNKELIKKMEILDIEDKIKKSRIGLYTLTVQDLKLCVKYGLRIRYDKVPHIF